MRKILDFMRIIAIVFLILNIYFYCYGFFKQIGWTPALLAGIIQRFSKTGMFNASWISKAIAILFLLLGCLGAVSRPDEKFRKAHIAGYGLIGLSLFFGADLVFKLPVPQVIIVGVYIILSSLGFLLVLSASVWAGRLLNSSLMKDVFNKENETFPQEERYMENEYSVNLPTEYRLKKGKRKGWINVVNPFRATMVLGTPGSGKSFAVINPFIKQHLAKQFTMYIYDYKFPDLSTICYNHLLKNQHKYSKPVQFCVINFEDASLSHRCNPLTPELLTDIADANESANTIMLNLNRKWIEKQGEFFVESPINFVAAIIWFLKLYQNGKYCTFPHLVEFLNRDYEEMFPILGSYPEIENLAKPFISAFATEAMEQLEGQIATARIALSRLASPQLYWVMTGDDFTLDLNNPEAPKVLCMGNNPQRQGIYGAALGLYNARIVKLVNQKKKHKISIIIDELPTMYFKGLNDLIATARSNKVSTLLGFQDLSQLKLAYGQNEAEVICNTIGTIFSGQVAGTTAKNLSERFGRNLQQRQSMSINQRDTNTSISAQLDAMIPQATIATLTQGYFVGAVADNAGKEEITQKVFHCKILMDVKAIQAEEAAYEPIPQITDFTDPTTGEDRQKELIQRNFYKVKKDIAALCTSELARIKADPTLRHLIKQKEE